MKLLRVVAAVAAVGLLTGCAAASVGPIATYPKPDAGMDALLEGELSITARCVWVDAGGIRALPVFVGGEASVSDGVLTWRGDEYADGDQIALGGGFGSGSGATIPEGCDHLVNQPDGVFYVSPY